MKPLESWFLLSRGELGKNHLCRKAAGRNHGVDEALSIKPRGQPKVGHPGDGHSVARFLSPFSITAIGMAVAFSTIVTVNANGAGQNALHGCCPGTAIFCGGEGKIKAVSSLGANWKTPEQKSKVLADSG